MKAIFAIALQTMRSAIRSKVLFLILLIIFIATAMLPTSVTGDSTLAGEFRIKINYSIGIITFLTGLAAMWVGTVNVSREIEDYQIHMVMTKPVSALTFWLGKFLGVLVLCLSILYISSAYIYYVVSSKAEDLRSELVEDSMAIMHEASRTLTDEQRKKIGNEFMNVVDFLDSYITEEEKKKGEKLFDDEVQEAPDQTTFKSRFDPLIVKINEYRELEKEILTGSSYYTWTKPNYLKLAKESIMTRGQYENESLIPPQMVNEVARGFESRSGTLPKPTQQGAPPKMYHFENLPELTGDEGVFIRYKVFVGDSLDQKPRNTAIQFAFADKDKKIISDRSQPLGIRSVRFYTQRIPTSLIKGHESLYLAVFNADHLGRRVTNGKPKKLKNLIIQASDGPHILIGKTSFFSNYWRCILLISLLISFLVIVGTAIGLCFSTPVAILMSVSYIIIGLSVSSLLSTEGQYKVEKYVGQKEQTYGRGLLSDYFQVLSLAMVSTDTFSHVDSLSSGKEITWKLILKVFLYDFLLKGLTLILLGLYALRRRELGLVVRKA